MRRFVKEVNLKANNPLIALPYGKFFLSEAPEKKKYLNEIEISKHYLQTLRKEVMMSNK
jgi:hypothetical protein